MRTGLISSTLARALNERLQVTSGDDTLRVLPDGSIEKTVLSDLTGLAFLASCMTCARLSLSITVRAGSGDACGCCCALFLRWSRAKSPSEGASSCADAAKGQSNAKSNATEALNGEVGNLDRMLSVVRQCALSGMH